MPRRLSWLLLTLAVCVQIGFGLYGIAAPLRFGHFGFHVAEHGLAARNLLEHGTWTHSLHTGLGPPPDATLNFHHPDMQHIPLAGLIWLTGVDTPWLARSMALLLTLFAFSGLVAFTWRARGLPTAAICALLWSISPMLAAYGNLPDVQTRAIGAVFWWGFTWLGCLTRITPIRVAALLGWTVVAAFSDWVWYPIALCLFAFWSVHVWRETPISERWRWPLNGTPRFYTYIGLIGMAGIMLGIAAQHVIRTISAGRWNDINGAYTNRTTGSIRENWPQVSGWMLQFHTPFVLIGTTCWLVFLWRRRSPARDWPAVFIVTILLAQTAWACAFPFEFTRHEYRSFWYVAPMAFACADLVVRVFCFSKSTAIRVFITSLVGISIVAICSSACSMAVRSRAQSGSIFLANYSAQTRFMAVGSLIDCIAPPRAVVVVDDSVALSPQLAWLIHRPILAVASPAETFALAPARPLVRLSSIDRAKERGPWRDAAASAQIVLMDGLSVAVWNLGPPSVEEARWRESDTYAAVDRYLHAPADGPVILEAGDVKNAVSFAEDVSATAETLAATRAGAAPVRARCHDPQTPR